MRKLLIVLALAAGMLAASAPTASAIPSTCELMRKLGYENVRECEDPRS